MAPGRKKVILTSTGVIIGGNQWKPWTRNPHKMGTLVICGRISVEFRFLCREACRFKSCHPHNKLQTLYSREGKVRSGQIYLFQLSAPAGYLTSKGLEFFWFRFCTWIRVGNNDWTSTGRKGGKQEQKIYDIIKNKTLEFMFLNVECAANIVK